MSVVTALRFLSHRSCVLLLSATLQLQNLVSSKMPRSLGVMWQV